TPVSHIMASMRLTRVTQCGSMSRGGFKFYTTLVCKSYVLVLSCGKGEQRCLKVSSAFLLCWSFDGCVYFYKGWRCCCCKLCIEHWSRKSRRCIGTDMCLFVRTMYHTLSRRCIGTDMCLFVHTMYHTLRKS